MAQRLDVEIVNRGIVQSRSQAGSYIKLGQVLVNGKVAVKSGQLVNAGDKIVLTAKDQYVSRAGLKLASVSQALNLNFMSKVVLDVGSSTGGFTDYALRNGADYVIAVDVGTNQLHPSLRPNQKIELHEQTDIRSIKQTSRPIDIVVIDVSFISVHEILPTIHRLSNNSTHIVVMVKPQFESGDEFKHKGVVKNDKMRRNIMTSFESKIKNKFIIINKSDSHVAGAKGNLERFYLLQKNINNNVV